MKNIEETIPCTICGKKTPHLGTKKCNGCGDLITQFDSLLLRNPDSAREWLIETLMMFGMFKDVICDSSSCKYWVGVDKDPGRCTNKIIMISSMQSITGQPHCDSFDE